MPSKPPCSTHLLEHQRGGEHDVGAARLDAGQRAPRGRQLGELGHQLAQPCALEHVALDARPGRTLGRGREVAHRAAHPDEPAAAAEPLGLRQPLADRGPRLFELLARRRARGGEELLGDADGAERPRREALRLAAGHRRELQAAAPEVEHDAVGERRRVDGGHVAQPRLLLGGEHADREAGALLGDGQQVGAVGGVADRAGGDGVDRSGRHPARGEVAPEHLERLEPSGDGVGLQRARGAQALGDPHRLLQLADPAPGGAGHVGEDDEPPGVGAEVDDRRHPLALRLAAREDGERRVRGQLGHRGDARCGPGHRRAARHDGDGDGAWPARWRVWRATRWIRRRGSESATCAA